MGKLISDNALDALLNYIKTNAAEMTVCSTQPTSYAEGHTTYMLATVAIDSDDFTGPANGDVSGRKVTIGQQATIEVINTGDAQHIVVLDDADEILAITTCTLQNITDGNTVTVPAWKIEVADAA
jgi:hypothetical protein